MKTFKLIPLILAVILMWGCEREEAEQGYEVTGTFKLVEATKYERIWSGDNNEYVRLEITDLYNNCSRQSTFQINANGTFEKFDFQLHQENCVNENLRGKWNGGELVYKQSLGEFKLDNSEVVYDLFSKEVSAFYTIDKIDVTYGSADEDGRYIYTYKRDNTKN